MVKKLGKKVNKLVRIRIGKLYIKHLQPGKFRQLGTKDIEKMLA